MTPAAGSALAAVANAATGGQPRVGSDLSLHPRQLHAAYWRDKNRTYINWDMQVLTVSHNGTSRSSTEPAVSVNQQEAAYFIFDSCNHSLHTQSHYYLALLQVAGFLLIVLTFSVIRQACSRAIPQPSPWASIPVSKKDGQPVSAQYQHNGGSVVPSTNQPAQLAIVPAQHVLAPPHYTFMRNTAACALLPAGMDSAGWVAAAGR
jgi:hypothetical protein